MVRRFSVAVALALLMGGWQHAQQQPFPSIAVDPMPLLDAASKEIGADALKCITFSGSGYNGAVGQAVESGVNIDWPRKDSLANYTRTINFETRTMKEEFDRKPGLNPASWRWGLGWQDGTPIQKNPHQTFVLNGNYGWHMDGAGAPPVASPPEDVERWQLDMWMTPIGFIKAARMPGANPRATWRWELGEVGRDPLTTVPEITYNIVITVNGKYKMDATMNKQNRLQRIHTMVSEPSLGDFNYEHEYPTQVQFGPVKWPTTFHHHEGWDDNYNYDNISAGHNAFGGEMKNVQPNVCPDPVPVPDSVRQATFPMTVTSQKIGNGVYLMGGGPANSIAVEFRDYIAVFDAPINEARSLAVIKELVKLMPNKPVRFVINSHQHFDHTGGLRAYDAMGATIITHKSNAGFLQRDVLNYKPRAVVPDLMSSEPPTELGEGYHLEVLTENYALFNGGRALQIFYAEPLQHAHGMIAAYLPDEKLLMEADMFDTFEPPPAQPTQAMKTLFNSVKLMNLDVAQIVPVHGKPVPWSDFVKAMGKAANVCFQTGTTGGGIVMAECPESKPH
jgi:glyoxylase-like metal-dependent hydrolase (beta-lactamase superfamily II)